jgi:hypothetical protein
MMENRIKEISDTREKELIIEYHLLTLDNSSLCKNSSPRAGK